MNIFHHNYHKNITKLNDTIYDERYLRPDLDDDILDLENFLNVDSLNSQQIDELQQIRTVDFNNFPVLQINQLLNELQNSFSDVDQKSNWKILIIIAYILNNEETFDLFYNPSIPEIVTNFLKPTSEQGCLIQALFLLNIITERTDFSISSDNTSFLISLLEDNSFCSDYKQLILTIITNNIDREISEEASHAIYATAQSLLQNGNLSIKSLSLRLIQKIYQKYQFYIPNDELELYYSYANSKYPDLSIDGLQFFISYAKNENNMDQIIEYNLIEKLLQISLYQNHKVYQYVLSFLEIISDQNEIGSKMVFDNVNIQNFFFSSFSIQKSILKIIYNISKYKIINSLLQISSETFDFLISFLENDDVNLILTTLNIILIFQLELIHHFDDQSIDLLDSLSFHSNQQISNISMTLLSVIKKEWLVLFIREKL